MNQAFQLILPEFHEDAEVGDGRDFAFNRFAGLIAGNHFFLFFFPVGLLRNNQFFLGLVDINDFDGEILADIAS